MTDAKYPIFCYGSNNPEQLQNRLGHAVGATYKARMVNAARVFTNSFGSQNGVATLIKCPGEDVLGLIFMATADDIKKLDQFEGSPHKYALKKVNVLVYENSNFVEKEVFAYIMTDTFLKTHAAGYLKPSDEYLAKIVKTLNTHWRKHGGKKFEPHHIPLHHDKKFCGYGAVFESI
ncbi:MAG: hypothetical protein Satyrvirus28_13 [Satyrvirus sp.]|uniref:Gamma-glutamylcyclotransferase AIG2-like domain-containing protein n=1 Tax=Satyrvirus sp. TaxID=2487771 RepID=A0A3G5AEK5_9VIRU|nr:MAG: hypothetical protein Satyrvirus28_13 [Satyrvirus sp.]